MILTNFESKIKLDDNLITIEDDVYISISLPLYWIQHTDNCEDCKSFYSKLKNESKDDWFLNHNNKYSKLEFLDNQYIGNGEDTIMMSEIDLTTTDVSNINKTEFYKIQNINKLECLFPSEYNSEQVIYKGIFLTPILKEFAETIINEKTFKIERHELEKFNLKNRS